jgi:superfamily II DNA or RNA helicase
MFQNEALKVICNHTVLTEGFDAPAVDLVVLNRFTESRSLWKQMIGRGLRKADGKTRCVVLDLAANGVTHGSIYDREIYDLYGHVESTESRQLQQEPANEQDDSYQYQQDQILKEWKPSPKPVHIIESLQKLKSKSPLHRLLTARLA